jgi:hypothetical protein
MPLATSVLKKAPEEVPRGPTGSVVFQTQDDKGVVFVLESEPLRLRVAWKTKKKFADDEDIPIHYDNFKVETPWNYFMIRMTPEGLITDTFLYFSPVKIKAPSGKVFMPALPNIYPSGHICNGTIRIIVTDPPEKKAFDLFTAFWTTPFTAETAPKDPSILPEALDFWGGNLPHPKSLLFAWAACIEQGTQVDWKTFKFRIGRRNFVLDTLEKAMEYALVFPRRKDYYARKPLKVRKLL